MKVTGKPIIKAYAGRHAGDRKRLERWVEVTEKTEWTCFADIRETHGSADLVNVESGGRVVVFNLGGNNSRIIAWVNHAAELVDVAEVLTHAEYSKDDWKKRL